jgi:lipopolysaccharide export system permease protein
VSDEARAVASSQGFRFAQRLPRGSIRRPLMRILDRYVLRNFLEPFLLCFLAFLGILLIFDLNDNLTDFVSAKGNWKLIGAYYLHQLPQFILLSLPLGLLLGLLYCLSKMSRANEVISMLTAGRSVVRILTPLLFCGLATTGLCLWLNYELAPRAEAVQKADLERIKNEKRADARTTIDQLLAKDRMSGRLWFIRRMRSDTQQLEDVHITQLDERGEPITRWFAQGAIFVPREAKWVLLWGRQVNYDENGNIQGEFEDWSQEPKESPKAARSMRGWNETPWRLGSTTMQADQLSVPQLRDYLRFNADFRPEQLAPFRTNWHYRWALPFTCLSVIFIAAPLGIVFSRRAVLTSVASSIFIFFGYLFVMFLFLALGKGGHVSPFVAGWLPNIILLSIGLYLLYLRSTNRELPRLAFRKSR